jgi:hypothetical protein
MPSALFFSGPGKVADWAKSQGQVTKRKWVQSLLLSWDFFLDSGKESPKEFLPTKA